MAYKYAKINFRQLDCPRVGHQQHQAPAVVAADTHNQQHQEPAVAAANIQSGGSIPMPRTLHVTRAVSSQSISIWRQPHLQKTQQMMINLRHCKLYTYNMLNIWNYDFKDVIYMQICTPSWTLKNVRLDQLSLLKGQSKKHSGSIPRNACVACET